MCSSTRAAFAATRSAARGGGRTFAGAALTPAAYRSIPADGNVAAHRPLWKLIPDELLGPDVVLIHTRCYAHRTRLPYHARRPRHVADGIDYAAQVSPQHGRVDMTSLAVPFPPGVGHCGQRRHEGEIRVRFCERSHLIPKSRVLGPPIGVEQHDAVWQGAPADRLDEDATKRRDTDATGQQDGRSSGAVEPEVPERAFDLDLGPEGNLLQHSFEGRVTQASRDLDHILTRCARDGEGTSIAFGVGLWRIEQSHVHRLPGAVRPIGRPLEPEGHRPLSHSFAARQFGPEERAGRAHRSLPDDLASSPAFRRSALAIVLPIARSEVEALGAAASRGTNASGPNTRSPSA